MKTRIVLFTVALALCLGLMGCMETPSSQPADDNTPVPDMAVVCDGSFTATVMAKENDGITLEVTNSKNLNTVSATFSSVKIGGKEYVINQTTYNDSPVSITRVGYDEKLFNLTLPGDDYVRLKVSSSEFTNANDYNNVDLTYSETYMGDNGTVTKTGKTISVKNA